MNGIPVDIGQTAAVVQDKQVPYAAAGNPSVGGVPVVNGIAVNGWGGGGGGGSGGGGSSGVEPECMTVAIPQGVVGGGTFQVQVPGRGMMQLTAPLGQCAGSAFTFQLPPVVANMPVQLQSAVGAQGTLGFQQQQQQQQQQQTTAAPPAAGSSTMAMMVTVPAGAFGGHMIQIQTPSGAMMQVAVPAGLGPGAQFQCAV